MAEGVGFEPTETDASAVFKTAAFVHSAIPPASEFAIPTLQRTEVEVQYPLLTGEVLEWPIRTDC